ncbi:MAG: TolC family protein [Gemmataceae bacterium]
MTPFRTLTLLSALVFAPGTLSAEEPKELTLGECIAIAVERQPSLKAAHASRDASAIGRQALYNIGPVGSLLTRDLPVRKAQADRGIAAADADVQKAYNEVVHDVTRLYYSVVYAKIQEQHAERVMTQLKAFADISKDLLDSPTPGEMTKAKYDTMVIAVAKVRKLYGKAGTGAKRAEAALREAMGVSDSAPGILVKDRVLPVMDQKVDFKKDEIVEMALSRRPEMVLAQAGADAFRLEVCAQDRVLLRRKVATFAAGADIHARMFPAGSRDPGGDYRPEPLLPEMPTLIVGRRSERVARAQALSRRADSVREKARNLIVLEAESAFLDFEDATKSVAIAKEAFDASRDLMDRVREGFDNPKAPKDQLVMNYGQAAEAQAEYHIAVFQHLLDLAALERITAGGVRPAFPGR